MLASPTLPGFVNCRNHYFIVLLTNLFQMLVKCNALVLFAVFFLIQIPL